MAKLGITVVGEVSNMKFVLDTQIPGFSDHLVSIHYANNKYYADGVLPLDKDMVENLSFAYFKYDGDIYYSCHRHDYAYAGDYFIDGGRDYIRTNANINFFKIKNGVIEFIEESKMTNNLSPIAEVLLEQMASNVSLIINYPLFLAERADMSQVINAAALVGEIQNDTPYPLPSSFGFHVYLIACKSDYDYRNDVKRAVEDGVTIFENLDIDDISLATIIIGGKFDKLFDAICYSR